MNVLDSDFLTFRQWLRTQPPAPFRELYLRDRREPCAATWRELEAYLDAGDLLSAPRASLAVEAERLWDAYSALPFVIAEHEQYERRRSE